MQRIAQLLKRTCAALQQNRLPAAGHEMTLHDALRLCAAQVSADGGSPRSRPQPLPRSIDVCRYASQLELQEHWRRWDEAPRQSGKLTVILALDAFLRGNLRELIARRHAAYRLVIVPSSGHWPGLDSFGDLALCPGSHGWRWIEICRDLGNALENAISAFDHDEQLLLVLPARKSQAT